jgi:hypothetical protein
MLLVAPVKASARASEWRGRGPGVA